MLILIFTKHIEYDCHYPSQVEMSEHDELMLRTMENTCVGDEIGVVLNNTNCNPFCGAACSFRPGFRMSGLAIFSNFAIR